MGNCPGRPREYSGPVDVPTAPFESTALAGRLSVGKRDIQALLDGAASLQAELPGSEKRLVSEDIRPDVQHENGLIRYLPRWFNHSELRFNRSACETLSAWLADHLARA